MKVVRVEVGVGWLRGVSLCVCVLFHERGYNFKWGEGIWCIGKQGKKLICIQEERIEGVGEMGKLYKGILI